LRQLVEKGERLYSTSLVLGEILGLLQLRHGFVASVAFMENIYPLVQWRWVDQPLLARIWQIAQDNSRRGFTIVDASVVACLEEHPQATCIALDRDFEGFDFPLLPAPKG
jgi:predicted nucleic acid-binding protein